MPTEIEFAETTPEIRITVSELSSMDWFRTEGSTGQTSFIRIDDTDEGVRCLKLEYRPYHQDEPRSKMISLSNVSLATKVEKLGTLVGLKLRAFNTGIEREVFRAEKPGSGDLDDPDERVS